MLQPWQPSTRRQRLTRRTGETAGLEEAIEPPFGREQKRLVCRRWHRVCTPNVRRMYPPALYPTPALATAAARLLIVLLAVDTVLLMLHVAERAGILADQRFAITHERGFPEIVQYLKAAGAAWLLLGIFRDTRSLTALVWSAGLAAIFVDDAFAVHEWIGAGVGPLLFPGGLGPLSAEHLAEFVFLAGGAVLFAAAALGAGLFEGAHGRAITSALGGALALLVLFGVGIDALHSMVSDVTARRVLAFVEDGGEMAAMSVVAAIAWTLRAQARASRRT